MDFSEWISFMNSSEGIVTWITLLVLGYGVGIYAGIDYKNRKLRKSKVGKI